MSTILHVGNISAVVLEDDLRAAFTRFGPVDNVEIVKDAVTGLSRRFALVTMSREEDAVNAIGRLNFTQYGGRTIGVSRSRPTAA